MQKLFVTILFVGVVAFPALTAAQGSTERPNTPPPPPPPTEPLPPAPLVSDEAPADSASTGVEEVTAVDETIEPLAPVTNPLPLLIVVTLAILLIIGGGWFLYKRGGKI